jgi:hypothetical protein
MIFLLSFFLSLIERGQQVRRRGPRFFLSSLLAYNARDEKEGGGAVSNELNISVGFFYYIIFP